MAIGSPDKTARLDQLRTFARVQVRSGYRSAEDVYADVLDAVRAEVPDDTRARPLADEFIADAQQTWRAEARSWPEPSEFDRLQAAFTDLWAGGVVVLQAIEDHWSAHDTLQRLTAAGEQPRGAAYFTHTDIWHCIENGMLELNVWHGTTANVAEGDELLDFVRDTLAAHGIDSLFDEGRIEVTVQWQRRP
ncbi:MAG: DUF6891 domain-containing protein [Nocardioidaceae bacterium]